MTADGSNVVRTARGAGRWFPADEAELRDMVERFIARAEVPTASTPIVAAIAPHAGYVYSGAVAGHTFRAIRDNASAVSPPETVVVLGTCHRASFEGVALMDGRALQTPLGPIELDQEAAAWLASCSPHLAPNYAPHNGEHSAENEVPFIQAALPNAKLVAGLIGNHDARVLDDLVRALTGLAARKRIVLVASTDLLHDADYARVGRTDRATLQSMERMEYRALLRGWDYSNQVCCGIGPVSAAMRFAEGQGCRKGTVLCYRNSGDDHPESRGNWVVGYGAVVFAVPA